MIRRSKVFNARTAVISISALAIFGIGCFSKNKESDAPTRKVKLSFSIQMIKFPDTVKTVSDSLIMYFHYKGVVCQFPYVSAIENDTAILSTNRKYTYFLYKSGSAYGYYKDSIDDPSDRMANVDSMLSHRNVTTFDFYNKDKLEAIDVVKNDPRYKLIEDYTSKTKGGVGDPDSIIFYYNDLPKDIAFSFSKSRDSATGLKLCRVDVVFNAQKYADYDAKLPARKFRFTLQEMPMTDKDSFVVPFFDKLNALKTMQTLVNQPVNQFKKDH